MRELFRQKSEEYLPTARQERTIDQKQQSMQSTMFFMNYLPNDIEDAGSGDWDNEDNRAGPHHRGAAPPHERMTPVETKQSIIGTGYCLVSSIV